jgi:hypothetical protein
VCSTTPLHSTLLYNCIYHCTGLELRTLSTSHALLLTASLAITTTEWVTDWLTHRLVIGREGPPNIGRAGPPRMQYAKVERDRTGRDSDAGEWVIGWVGGWVSESEWCGSESESESTVSEWVSEWVSGVSGGLATGRSLHVLVSPNPRPRMLGPSPGLDSFFYFHKKRIIDAILVLILTASLTLTPSLPHSLTPSLAPSLFVAWNCRHWSRRALRSTPTLHPASMVSEWVSECVNVWVCEWVLCEYMTTTSLLPYSLTPPYMCVWCRRALLAGRVLGREGDRRHRPAQGEWVSECVREWVRV